MQTNNFLQNLSLTYLKLFSLVQYNTLFRLEFLGTEAACVENPCSEGESLWTDGLCYPLDEELEEGMGLECSTYLLLVQDSRVE